MLRGEPFWDGDSWQEYCDELLTLHHPDAYQAIPAADRGDCGLEGHSTDGQGCGYQCYAPDEAIDIATRRKRQIRKVTETVDTLIAQRDRLDRVLGRHRIQRLIFLFPRHDSAEVNAHLRKQEGVLREAVSEFSIGSIAQDVVLAAWSVPPYLKAEKEELDRVGAARTHLPSVSVNAEDVESFRREAAEQLVGTLQKLERRFGETRAPDVLDLALEDKLVGDEQERFLEQRPSSYERYQRLKKQERNAITRMTAEGGTSDLTLGKLGERIGGEIGSQVPGIDSVDVATLAAGVVSSWLIECPLDFPEVEE
jgi:hypothetical protein